MEYDKECFYKTTSKNLISEIDAFIWYNKLEFHACSCFYFEQVYTLLFDKEDIFCLHILSINPLPDDKILD